MSISWLTPLQELVRFLVWLVFIIPLRLWQWGWGILVMTDNSLQLLNNFKLWIAFEPMFGDYDWRGHLIGFFLRGVRLIFSLAVDLFLVILSVALPLFWYIILVGSVFSIFAI